ELVDVDERDPAGIAAVTPNTVCGRGALPRNQRPVPDLDDSRRDLRRELGAPVVGAPVVIQVEPLHTLNAVEAHPLGQVTGFVSENGANRQADGRPCAERPRPARSHVANPASPFPRSATASPQLGGGWIHPSPVLLCRPVW